MNNIEHLFNILNEQYKLNIVVNKNYTMAFTHSSFINEQNILKKHEHYERLEYLGDAVLELTVSEYLYNKFPNMPEGELTKLRASTVCEPTLVKYTKNLQFDKYICLGKGEEKSGGRNRGALLADIFEAFIGALYLDKGIAGVKSFLDQTLFLEISNNDDFLFVDYKTILQEFVYKEKLGEISYELISSTGPAHDKTFESCVIVGNKKVGSGIAKTKKESEQLSAKEALTSLKYF